MLTARLLSGALAGAVDATGEAPVAALRAQVAKEQSWPRFKVRRRAQGEGAGGLTYGDQELSSSRWRQLGEPLELQALCCAGEATNELQAELLDAVAENEAVRVEEILAAGQRPMCLFGSAPLVGASTLTAAAASAGGLEVLRLLLEAMAEVNSQDSCLQSPLHVAQRSACRLLLDFRADLELRDFHGRRPLHLAGAEVGGELLAASADVCALDPVGRAPLHLAAKRGDTELAELLLEHQASLEQEDRSGATPLYYACQASANFSLDRFGRSPCFAAAESGQPQVLRLLLQAPGAAKAAFAAPDLNGRTALAAAAVENYVEVVQMLLDEKMDPNDADKNLCTPLHVASELGHFDLLCLLLEGAADPACRDASGASPLHRAARRGTSDQKSAVGALLDAGALCDSQDAQGRTALHEAAREGHASAVRRLLEGRADSNVPDGQNHTPLHLAAQQGRLETVQECSQSWARTATARTATAAPRCMPPPPRAICRR
ncbi:unnamed protein product [Effrenium voratum]|nr:unnamed protein product [Effrenium voratum]